MTEERRIPNWLNDDEDEHLKIKKRFKLLEYKIRFFKRERKRVQKMLDNLIANREMQAEVRGLLYHSRQELDEAYMAGLLEDREYMRQRSSLWHVYSDRGHTAELEWLDSEIEKYETELNALHEWTELKKKESTRKRGMKRQRLRHKTYMQRTRRRRKRKQALEERWRRYGIG